ncbi:MAG: hypothetical protein M3R55_11430 [Acidobacteriota bacterium]|nr:hypothetical protein [Acidobacteriota bacterium]
MKIQSGAVMTWYARDLNCAKLQMRAHGYELNLVSVTAHEPQAELFTIPAFQDVPPSNYYRLPAGSDSARQRDAHYFLNRPAAK